MKSKIETHEVPFVPEKRDEDEPMTREEIISKIENHRIEITRLKALSAEEGENIDVDLESEEYMDFGYMAEARELEEAIKELEAKLVALDDKKSAEITEAAEDAIEGARQRNLDI